MRGLPVPAALLTLTDLPSRRKPVPPVRGGDRADGIAWECAWCGCWDRVIAESPMEPGDHLTASCDACKGLTRIIRKVAMFA